MWHFSLPKHNHLTLFIDSDLEFGHGYNWQGELSPVSGCAFITTRSCALAAWKRKWQRLVDDQSISGLRGIRNGVWNHSPRKKIRLETVSQFYAQVSSGPLNSVINYICGRHFRRASLERLCWINIYWHLCNKDRERRKREREEKLHGFRKMDKERAQMLSITKSHFRCAWAFSIQIFIALLSTKMRRFLFYVTVCLSIFSEGQNRKQDSRNSIKSTL